MTTPMTAVATAPATGLKGFNDFLRSKKTSDYLSDVLASKKEHFVNNLVALVGSNKLLQECQPATVMYAAIKATALNLPLDPNLGYAYVIPYNNRQKDGSFVKEAQFQIGYKGFLQMAQRSGVLRRFHFTDIREGELRGRDFLSGDLDIQEVANRQEKPVVGYVVWVQLTNGFEHTHYMSVEDVKAHAEAFSKTYQQDMKSGRQTSVWSTNFDAMARKTVIKLLFQSGLITLSTEMLDANKSDQAVFRDKTMNADYVDNGTVDTVAQEIADNANQGEAMSFEQQEAQPQPEASNDEMPDVFK